MSEIVDTPEVPLGRETNAIVCRPYLMTPGVFCRKAAKHRVGHIDLCPRHYAELVEEQK